MCASAAYDEWWEHGTVALLMRMIRSVLFARFAHQVETTYRNRIKIPARGQ